MKCMKCEDKKNIMKYEVDDRINLLELLNDILLKVNIFLIIKHLEY